MYRLKRTDGTLTDMLNLTRAQWAQRRLIMRALTNAMANDCRSTAGGALTRPTEDEWMQLIRLFSTIKTSVRKPLP